MSLKVTEADCREFVNILLEQHPLEMSFSIYLPDSEIAQMVLREIEARGLTASYSAQKLSVTIER